MLYLDTSALEPSVTASHSPPTTMSDDAGTSDPCAMDNGTSYTGLRIGAVFIILVRRGSAWEENSLMVSRPLPCSGHAFPLHCGHPALSPHPSLSESSRTHPSPWLIQTRFAKFFGSGVIIATAFIHLLAPAFDELGSECLTGTWTEYDWAPAIAMASVYAIFFAEIAAYRIGTKKLERLGIAYTSHNDDETDAHAHSHRTNNPLEVDTSGPHHDMHGHPSHPDATIGDRFAHQHEKDIEMNPEEAEAAGAPSLNHMGPKAEAAAQLIAVAILEFGVILHSIFIGLTLGTTGEFIVLFIVIIFHQMFEGLGLGSRLSALSLPGRWSMARYVAAFAYSVCTPIGLAIGIGVRNSFNGNGRGANITSGILDAISAGILLYTGLVELLAHEILLNPRMMKSSPAKLTYVFSCILLGSGLMALLGRWA